MHDSAPHKEETVEEMSTHPKGSKCKSMDELRNARNMSGGASTRSHLRIYCFPPHAKPHIPSFVRWVCSHKTLPFPHILGREAAARLPSDHRWPPRSWKSYRSDRRGRCCTRRFTTASPQHLPILFRIVTSLGSLGSSNAPLQASTATCPCAWLRSAVRRRARQARSGPFIALSRSMSTASCRIPVVSLGQRHSRRRQPAT